MDAQVMLSLSSIIFLIGSFVMDLIGLFIVQLVLGIMGIILMAIACLFGLFVRDVRKH